MLFDDHFHDYGVAPTSVDLHGTDVDYSGASGIAAAATANDDWLLGTGLHALDFNVFTPPASAGSPGADAGSGIAAIAAGATAADHDRMLVINPPATDPNYWAPPPPKPVIKKVSTISWYEIEDAPLASSPKPT